MVPFFPRALRAREIGDRNMGTVFFSDSESISISSLFRFLELIISLV